MRDVFLGLIVGVVLGAFLFYQYNDRETIEPCGYGKEHIIDNFQEWITKGIQEKDARIKDKPIKVVDAVGVLEYNSIPHFDKIELYEDFKDSRVCKATLLVNYTPNSNEENIEEIRVRFQKVNSSPDEGGYRSMNMSVSGFDFEEIAKSALEYFRKYNKK